MKRVGVGCRDRSLHCRYGCDATMTEARKCSDTCVALDQLKCCNRKEDEKELFACAVVMGAPGHN